MGFSSRIALHAWYRHGTDRVADHRKAPPRLGRRLWALAGLILVAPSVDAEPLRIALFHTELDRDGPGLLLCDILEGDDPQVEAVTSVVRAADADILVLGGVDHDLQQHTLTALAESIGGYPYRFAAEPNRGLHTGEDLNANGKFGEPDDAQGYAAFAGQGGLAVLSREPIDASAVQDFTRLLWHELPGGLADETIHEEQRLSTTAHWILPVGAVSLMVWHATPPVFDGPEDRNGRRNHDEAALWLRVLEGEVGIRPDKPVVLLGLANLDVADSDGRGEALSALLTHPDLFDAKPASDGAVAATESDAGINLSHNGDPALDTVDWPDTMNRPGNRRVDYILTDRRLTVIDAGVIWPAPGGSLRSEVERASRHRLLWVDVEVER